MCPLGVPVIALAEHALGYMGNPAEQLLAPLAKRGWSIVYGRGALSWWARDTDRWKAAPILPRAIAHESLREIESGKLPMRWRRIPAYDRAAITVYTRLLMRAASIDRKRDKVVLVYQPTFADYIQSFEPCEVVYFAGDVFAHQPGWADDLEYHERQQQRVLARANLILAGSEGVRDYLPPEYTAPVQIQPAGADFERFSEAMRSPCPNDLDSIPRPWIVCHGHFNTKIDFALIAEIAGRRPDWHWVLVGPVNEHVLRTIGAQEWEDFCRCRDSANVHFLGYRPFDVTPKYVAYADVNVIPSRTDIGPWFTTGYPLKVNEALATGKPLVCAPYPIVKQKHLDVIAFPDSARDWEAAIADALAGSGVGDAASRIATAEFNSYTSRARTFCRYLRDAGIGAS
jgi:glycosyltransferase involved in cell wall biosynthesis